jgi:hypothetical protein
MELIQTVTVGSGGAAAISFPSIPATYDDLVVVTSLRGTLTNSQIGILLTFNNDSGANYLERRLVGTGSSTNSGSNYSTNFIYSGQAPANTSTASTFGNTSFYVPNYRSSVAKSVSIDSVREDNATATFLNITAGLWSGTAAINRLDLTCEVSNWAEGSSASLYGIRKFNTSAQPKATGGAISFDAVNNKWVHVFSTSGTFTPTANITCEYLVVAGGGSGGGNTYSGGGGAGGYRSSVSGESSGGGGSAESALSLLSGTGYTVTIGAGGAAQTGSFTRGNSGSNSVFSTITATGGGGGGGYIAVGPPAGANGGSGGGAAGDDFTNYAGGTGTANQGFNGGQGQVGPPYAGGGGGGAGQAGAPWSTTGNGGNGVASSITGTSVTRAGGGGRAWVTSSTGTGGSGGGGNGGTNAVIGFNGQANTGGGGGGGGLGPSFLTSGAGGSGIVIVRYNA